MPKGVYTRPSAMDRFVDRLLVMPNGCWEWAGSVNSHGYGNFGIGKRIVKAHRFAYEQFVGPIPKDMTIDHLCRVRHCVNPSHLEVVSNRENVLRGVGHTARNARKTHCINGHPFDTANTMIDREGKRGCRACRRRRNAEYVLRKKAEGAINGA